MSQPTSQDPVKEREMAQKFVQLVMMQAQNTLYVPVSYTHLTLPTKRIV